MSGSTSALGTYRFCGLVLVLCVEVLSIKSRYNDHVSPNHRNVSAPGPSARRFRPVFLPNRRIPARFWMGLRLRADPAVSRCCSSLAQSIPVIIRPRGPCSGVASTKSKLCFVRDRLLSSRSRLRTAMRSGVTSVPTAAHRPFPSVSAPVVSAIRIGFPNPELCALTTTTRAAYCGYSV